MGPKAKASGIWATATASSHTRGQAEGLRRWATAAMTMAAPSRVQRSWTRARAIAAKSPCGPIAAPPRTPEHDTDNEAFRSGRRDGRKPVPPVEQLRLREIGAQEKGERPGRRWQPVGVLAR